MPLKLCTATPADAPRIAEIHMLAFGSNKMLRAQFPTPAIRAALQKCIEDKALADIEDPKISVLVVRELLSEEQEVVKDERGDVGMGEVVPKEGKVISFAKWSHPIEEGENYVEPPWVWPEGTNLEVLENWGREIDEAYDRVLGATPCYRKASNLLFPFLFLELFQATQHYPLVSNPTQLLIYFLLHSHETMIPFVKPILT
jgi:hypothetical protein